MRTWKARLVSASSNRCCSIESPRWKHRHDLNKASYLEKHGALLAKIRIMRKSNVCCVACLKFLYCMY